ncbi:MAG: type IV secretion system DNA-binding domain-containing protein [Xanthomonadaceae bacterium]|nr:type IV secretion system DNA-binding domain-containing protein [Rhodospirillaceae bacterium]NIA18001.1 type IV secretion system DNA-binding domain-containing protein [Xanthomonadaceae bacterium]
MLENQNKKEDITFFAETDFRNRKKKFGIKTDDRRRHIYLIGKTGMGKTTMMENMIYHDIQTGKGVALVDPHGDFVEKIIDFVPARRINDVVYFNPSDVEHPIAFNILESMTPESKNIAASGLIGIFKKLWADSWGPRLEYLLRNAILALMDYPNSTILGVMRILIDKNFRKKVIAYVKDPIVKSFWEDEYTKYSTSFQVEAISPIQNKIGQFLSYSLIRNIIGQTKSSFDIRDIMDNRKILLMNFSKGRIGEDASALLGAMMITKIQLAAMERVNIPEEDRQDFYLYVDEFQNFATESFANILSEARKYRLNLIITNQYIEQLDEKVQAAILGNVGTIISFRVGPSDAEILEKEFAPKFTEEDLLNLAKWHIYIKLMIDGISSEPFSATGLPPLTKKEGNVEKIIQSSREHYSRSRSEIEEKIIKWTEANKEKNIIRNNQNSGNKILDKKETIKKYKKDEIKNKNEREVLCSYCGAKTTIFFKPDGIRPIFCKQCLTKLRNKELVIQKNNKGEYIILKEPNKQKDPLEISLSQLKFKKNKEEKNKSLDKDKQPKKNKKDIQEKNDFKNDKLLKPGEKIKF